ncbi:MAG TPA: DUF5615 family PIN-like protein [Tepidiformaceae bacterium]|nr:DUF5615 family PIN-like protein [Tepidiformaceae bacterium]
MLPLYIDEDSVDRRFISALERLRVEFVSARALGRDGVNDEDHLMYAASEGRMLLTANYHDYLALQTSWGEASRDHCGILVRVQNSVTPERLAQLVFNELSERTPETLGMRSRSSLDRSSS